VIIMQIEKFIIAIHDMENLHLKTYSNETEMQEFRNEFAANINAAISHAKEGNSNFDSLSETDQIDAATQSYKTLQGIE